MVWPGSIALVLLLGAPKSTLDWKAPPGCPDTRAVIGEVEQILGGPLDEPRAAAVDAHALVEREGAGFRLELDIETASGVRRRTVEADDCAELGHLAALLVAMAIDPGIPARSAQETSVGEAASESTADAVLEPATDSTPFEEEAELPSEGKPTVDVRPEETNVPPSAEPTAGLDEEPREDEGTSRSLVGSIFAQAGLHTGALPSATAMVELGAAVTWRALRIELSAGHRFSRPVRSLAGGGAGADIWSTVGQLEVCGTPRVPRVDFPLCAGIEAGTMAGRGRGVSAPRTGRGPWFAFRAGGGLVVLPWRRVGIVVDVDLVVPVLRTGFEIEGVGELHRVGPVGVDALGGAEVRF